MNELLILRAAMEDIAASGSEKANIALVLAEQARKRADSFNGISAPPEPVSKSAVDEILDLVQRANACLSAAIRANSTKWSASTDVSIEEAREKVNKIAQALVKDRK